MKFKQPLKHAAYLGLLLAATTALAQPEELILSAQLFDRPAVPVVVLKVGESYHVPFTQAEALGLPGARSIKVEGVTEPVISGLVVKSVSEDSLVAEVPLAYFNAQLFDLQPRVDSATLTPRPAAWFNYDLFYQPLEGQRPLGGTFSVAGGYNGWAIESLWQLSRSTADPFLARGATALTHHEGGRTWSLGDASVAQGIPLLSNRQGLGLQIQGSRAGAPQAKDMSLKGAVPSSGVVTVMANQQQLYRAMAQAGTYEVRGLPSLPGDARYTVYFDDGSNVRLLNSMNVSEAVALLNEGAIEYQATLGVPRVLDPGSAVFKYETSPLLEGSATYGLSRHHNVSANAYLTETESWLGTGLRTEWTPHVHSLAEAYAVRGPDNSGLLTSLSANYSATDFSLGASVSRYSNPKGTPVDGFSSEYRVFGGYRGVNAYWLQSTSVDSGTPSKYYTYGLSKSYAWGPAALSLHASRTVRDRGQEPIYFALMLTWEFSRGKAVSTTLTKNKLTAEANYFGRDWGASLESSSGGSPSTSASGYYETNYGTVFGSVSPGAAGRSFGVSGGAVAYKTEGGVNVQPTGHQQGDSLLLVATGAPGAEVVVESQRRYATNGSGYVAIPFDSKVPQRVELDIRTLTADFTAEEIRQLVQTLPHEALELKFETRPMGQAVSLRLPNGEDVPEGSVVSFPEETTLVSGSGMVWVPGGVKTFRVQTARGKFCTVRGADTPGEKTCE